MYPNDANLISTMLANRGEEVGTSNDGMTVEVRDQKEIENKVSSAHLQTQIEGGDEAVSGVRPIDVEVSKAPKLAGDKIENPKEMNSVKTHSGQKTTSDWPTKFADDGTLDLLRISCQHPELISVLSSLMDKWIPEYASILDKLEELPSKFVIGEIPSGPCPRALLIQIRSLEDNISKAVIRLDCLELDQLKPSWGSRDVVRQSRRELLHVLEELGNGCERLTKSSLVDRVEALPKVEHPIEHLNIPKVPHGVGIISAPPTASTSRPTTSAARAVAKRRSGFSDIPSRANEVEKKKSNFSDYVRPVRAPSHRDGIHDDDSRHRGFSSHPPKPLPSYGRGRGAASQNTTNGAGLTSSIDNVDKTKSQTQSADRKKRVGHGEFIDSESDQDQPRKKHKGKRPPVDWDIRLRDKIDNFKAHTSQGGCVTSLYDQPVTREALLTLLNKCSENLISPNPSPIQTKMAIETFIAALDCAYSHLQQLRVNKTQMRLLHQSAAVLDKLSAPTDLLPELKSLQGLLKTFGMF